LLEKKDARQEEERGKRVGKGSIREDERNKKTVGDLGMGEEPRQSIVRG